MIFARVFSVLAAAVLISHGQVTTYNISGAVKAKGGAAIAGATVTLEKAKVNTTTDAEGKFTLGQGTGILHHGADRVTGSLRSLVLSNDRCIVTVSGKSAVTVDLYNGRGQVLSSERRTVAAGTHSLALRRHGSGLVFCRVGIDNERHVFVSADIGQSYKPATLEASAGAAGGLARQLRAGAKMRDVLVVAKEGYVDYRITINNSDTSGLNLIMLVNEGNVTDIDGNVYQSVKVGTQIWTVTNFKATKFNDGTPIPNAATWGGGAPVYCYPQNNPILGAHYGAVYTGGAAKAANFAPKGWHVPTKAEWTTLVDYLKANGYNSKDTSDNYTAKALAAREDWGFVPSKPGDMDSYMPGSELRTNNSSGLAFLPAGFQKHGVSYEMVGWHTFFWRADGGARSLGAGFWGLWEYNIPDDVGACVRLVRDN